MCVCVCVCALGQLLKVPLALTPACKLPPLPQAMVDLSSAVDDAVLDKLGVERGARK